MEYNILYREKEIDIYSYQNNNQIYKTNKSGYNGSEWRENKLFYISNTWNMKSDKEYNMKEKNK